MLIPALFLVYFLPIGIAPMDASGRSYTNVCSGLGLLVLCTNKADEVMIWEVKTDILNFLGFLN